MAQNEGTIVIEGARLLFRNFEGKEGRYNRAGDRNFSVAIDKEMAETLEADGWNIKWLKPREEDEDGEDQAILQVSLNYDKGRPPVVAMITSRGRTNLDAKSVEHLDHADIINADLIIRPYHWDVNEKQGIKAYLKSLFVTVEEDELERKYGELEQQ